MPQQLYSRREVTQEQIERERVRVHEALCRQWSKFRSRGQKVFKVTMALAFIGLACDVALIVTAFIWPHLLRLDPPQLQGVLWIYGLGILVVGPALGWMAGGPLWRVLERYFDETLTNRRTCL